MTVISPANAAQPELLSLPVNDHTQPSATNPRKFFAPGPLEELAQSLQTHGMIQPIVVRRLNGHADRYEIIAGERRWKAAKLAKLTHVPAIVRQLTDLQVLEAQLIENGQREDIHPIEAADTFVALKKLDGSYTAKAIAARIGKSERYVQNVLHYAVLIPKAKTAFMNNEINAGHADLIARLTPENQEKALKACFDSLYGEDRERGVISVRALDSWIADHIRLELTKGAPDLQMFPELQKVVDAAPADAPLTLLQVSTHYDDKLTPKGVLGREAYRTVRKGDTCKHKERAVVVLGENRGKFIEICRAKTTCSKHWHFEAQRAKATKANTSPKATAAEQKAAQKHAADKARDVLRQKVLSAAADAFNKRAPKVVPFSKPAAALLLYSSGASSLRELLMDKVSEIHYDVYSEKDYQQVATLLKPFGVDVAAIEKDLAPKPKPTTKKTPTTDSGAARASKGVRAAASGKKKATTKKPARKAGAKK